MIAVYPHPRNVGISLRSLELFLMVCLTRYLDLFTTFYSLYNSTMKVAYILLRAYMIHTIRYNETTNSTYDQHRDAFPICRFAVTPCLILAAIIHLAGSGINGYDTMELLWTLSILLEVVAMVPQLLLLQRYRTVDDDVRSFIFFMGIYRALYILNWVYRANYEPGYKHHYLVYVCGVAQTLSYALFFHYSEEKADDDEIQHLDVACTDETTGSDVSMNEINEASVIRESSSNQISNRFSRLNAFLGSNRFDALWGLLPLQEDMGTDLEQNADQPYSNVQPNSANEPIANIDRGRAVGTGRESLQAGLEFDLQNVKDITEPLLAGDQNP
jgi:ER lumen protein retaining receptor